MGCWYGRGVGVWPPALRGRAGLPDTPLTARRPPLLPPAPPAAVAAPPPAAPPAPASAACRTPRPADGPMQVQHAPHQSPHGSTPGACGAAGALPGYRRQPAAGWQAWMAARWVHGWAAPTPLSAAQHAPHAGRPVRPAPNSPGPRHARKQANMNTPGHRCRHHRPRHPLQRRAAAARSHAA